ATFSDVRSTVTLPENDCKVTNPPSPEADPADPRCAERMKLPAPDPISRPPSAERVIPPPLPVPAPLANRVNGPAAGNWNTAVNMLIPPPLPFPTPLASMTAPFTRFRLEEPRRKIVPPVPSLPSGATFSDVRSIVRLPPVSRPTLPPLPEADPGEPPVADTTKLPAADPIAWSLLPNNKTLISPPLPVLPPLAAKATGAAPDTRH